MIGRVPGRVIAAALVAYGLAGLVLVTAAATAVAPAVATVVDLGRSSADVRATLSATADAFDGFGASLIEGRQSAERAATSARSSAAAARDLAEAMSISVFGAQPLLPIATGFAQQAIDLGTLASELDDLGFALGRNESDVQRLRTEVERLEERMGDLEASPLLAGADRLGTLAYALLGWLALQAAAAIGLGVTLWRAVVSG